MKTICDDKEFKALRPEILAVVRPIETVTRESMADLVSSFSEEIRPTMADFLEAAATDFIRKQLPVYQMMDRLFTLVEGLKGKVDEAEEMLARAAVIAKKAG